MVHIHGCVDDPDSMVITTRTTVHSFPHKCMDFLRHLFEKKTVLFLGYGLEEIESWSTSFGVEGQA